MTLTLKKRLKNAGILTAVFIVAVIIFSYVTNKGNDNMTADMGAATFPQISFSYGEYKINTLHDHTGSEPDPGCKRRSIWE